MDCLPRVQTIVTPQWVNERRQSLGSRLVILEVSWAVAKDAHDYLQGHVPGAIHLNTDEFENGYPRWHLRPVNELHSAIGRMGIGPESTVVVYSKQVNAAARAWWVLLYAGVADVRFLDGGYEAWVRAGFPGEIMQREPQPVSFHAEVRSRYVATTAYVRGHFLQGATWMADVRSRDEYLGSVSGYPYMDFKGRIPGAVHLQNASDSALIYHNDNGTLRRPEEIRALWRRCGIQSTGSRFDREVIFYCGNGWRSSLAFLYAWILGMDNMRNYSDGWSGWSTIYLPDSNYRGATPGWRQVPSGNPVQRL